MENTRVPAQFASMVNAPVKPSMVSPQVQPVVCVMVNGSGLIPQPGLSTTKIVVNSQQHSPPPGLVDGDGLLPPGLVDADGLTETEADGHGQADADGQALADALGLAGTIEGLPPAAEADGL